MCAGGAPELEERTSFIGRWMDILRPGYERVKDLPEAARPRPLENEAVLISLENLMGFPFVRAAVESQEMSLHGLWNDIADGSLTQYDPASGGFVTV